MRVSVCENGQRARDDGRDADGGRVVVRSEWL